MLSIVDDFGQYKEIVFVFRQVGQPGQDKFFYVRVFVDRVGVSVVGCVVELFDDFQTLIDSIR